jgi:hypothetical protein
VQNHSQNSILTPISSITEYNLIKILETFFDSIIRCIITIIKFNYIINYVHLMIVMIQRMMLSKNV